MLVQVPAISYPMAQDGMYGLFTDLYIYCQKSTIHVGKFVNTPYKYIDPVA